MASLEDHLKHFKDNYEAAITNGGVDAKQAEIRSSKLINQIHEYVKEELIANSINPTKIFPPLGKSNPEITLTGYFKTKAQDITVLSAAAKPEKVVEGVLIGKLDKIGKDVSDRSISINVRSQLSSINKNFDTLYERTFAESTNLHKRLQRLVMGEIYMLPVRAYDPKAMKNRKIAFLEPFPLKFIPAFHEINKRRVTSGEEEKYERVCLLIVNFDSATPKVIKDVNELVSLGVANSKQVEALTLDGLNIDNFVEDLLQVYKTRHGSLNALF